MKAIRTAGFVLALITATTSPLAVADRGWRGDIRHGHRQDVRVWRGGHWVHGHHHQRFGWWWVAGGLWYLYPAPVYSYPAPVYPYPDPYIPPVVVVPPQAPAPAPALGPPTQYWYYCEPAKGYYPYVPSCPGGWRAVPAIPTDLR